MRRPRSFVQEGPGRYRVEGIVTKDDIIKAAAALLYRDAKAGDYLTEPRTARELFACKLTPHEGREVFAAVALNARHRLVAYEELFFGTIDGATVSPRVVVQFALQHHAAALIVAHNHPSGDCTPSNSDQAITRRLKDALGLVDVKLLDHVVVASGDTLSMAEVGLV